MTNLIHLVLFLSASAPLSGYVGLDERASVTRRVDFSICRVIRFETVIRTNGIFVLQIAQNIKTDGWETFGAPIIGPTYGTNYQTVPVPLGEGYFRVVKQK